MAELTIKIKDIIDNIYKLDDYLYSYNLDWTLVTKLISGDETILREILHLTNLKKLHSAGESHLRNLIVLKKINPNLKTMFINPPNPGYVDEYVQYADITLNTALPTIALLNTAAKQQKKKHQIVLMIELGEIREGIEPQNIMAMIDAINKMDSIEIIGIGATLGCMFGVAPTREKIQQLLNIGSLISDKLGKNLELISAGSSVVLPLIENGDCLDFMNHFRIGEAVFMGTTPYTNKQFLDLSIDAIKFYGTVTEIECKNVLPSGVLINSNDGYTTPLNMSNRRQKSEKVIFDFGLVDVEASNVRPKYNGMNFIGATSDMIVYDLGRCNGGTNKCAIGDNIEFEATYMGLAQLMNSNYIVKKYI